MVVGYWVGLTLIWVFHHIAQQTSLFCQISICPSRTGQTVECQNTKSTQPSNQPPSPPCTVVARVANWTKGSARLCETIGSSGCWTKFPAALLNITWVRSDVWNTNLPRAGGTYCAVSREKESAGSRDLRKRGIADLCV